MEDKTETSTQQNQHEPRPEPLESAAPQEVVNYYFPVEIVVAGRLADQERELIQSQIYRELYEAIIDRLA